MGVAIGDHDAERGPAADGAGDDFVRERAYKLSASCSRLRAPPRVDVVLVCAAFGGVPQIAHDNRGACKSRCVADERHRLPRRDGVTGRQRA